MSAACEMHPDVTNVTRPKALRAIRAEGQIAVPCHEKIKPELKFFQDFSSGLIFVFKAKPYLIILRSGRFARSLLLY